jgi:hypothetical protein
MWRETGLSQSGLQLWAAGIENDISSDNDGIARETRRLIFLDFNQIRNLRKRAPRVIIERGRVVDRCSSIQRAKASVEMVEVAIDQLQRNDATAHLLA